MSDVALDLGSRDNGALRRKIFLRLDRILDKAAKLWITLFWISCVAIPLGVLFARVTDWHALFDPVLIHVAGVTFTQALLSAFLSAVIGLPLGLWIGSGAGRGKIWAEMLLALPFGVPTVVAGLTWVLILGRAGVLANWGIPLDWAYSFKAVILAHVAFNAPWIALWVAQSRTFVPENLLESARTLGAGPIGRFRFVIWPQVKWAFLSAVCQSLVFCAMSFALILVLGGGPPVETLETVLYSKIRFGSLDLSGAIACGMWELLITFVPWCLVAFFQAQEVTLGQGAQAARAQTSRCGTGDSPGSWKQGALAAVFFVPYLSTLTAIWFFVDKMKPEAWHEILSAARVSAILALGSGIGATITALAAVMTIESISAEKRPVRALVAFLMGLPSGISALVLGLGLWLAYGRFIDPFSGSATAMIALQTVIFFPIAFRIFWPVARDRRTRLLEAATTLGASPVRAFWVVEWPRWRLPLLSAFGMVVGASLGEVAAVSLFYSENLIPLPLLITRWSGQYRFDDAQVVAAFLLILCTGAIVSAYVLRGWTGQESVQRSTGR